MASISTVIADLMGGNIIGIGAKPAANEENARSNISVAHQLKHSAVHMKATISATNRLGMVEAPNSIDFNGNYVHFADGWATAGTMDINRTLVISGNFSGCLWRIYREGVSGGGLSDVFKCVHIARPAGEQSDAIVALVTAYATGAGWTLIQEVPSAGYAPPKGEVIMVSRMTHNRTIDTVRLEINNTGLITGKTQFTAQL